MNLTEFEILKKKAEEKGLVVVAYPRTWLLNVTDSDGIIQSYYASTGTAVFRDSNDKYKQKHVTKKNYSFDHFIILCEGKTDEDILDFFEED